MSHVSSSIEHPSVDDFQEHRQRLENDSIQAAHLFRGYRRKDYFFGRLAALHTPYSTKLLMLFHLAFVSLGPHHLLLHYLYSALTKSAIVFRLAFVIMRSICISMPSMPMSVVVGFWRPNILELVHRSALRAALDGSVAGAGQPDGDVRVGGAASAAEVLFVTVAFDYDWVVEGAYTRLGALELVGESSAAVLRCCGRLKTVLHTFPARIQRPHVKDIYSLHLAEDFQALETSRLFEIGRDGAGWCAGREEVTFAGDFCAVISAIDLRVSHGCGRCTFKRRHMLAGLAWLWIAVRGLVYRSSVPSSGALLRLCGGIGSILRVTEVVKERVTAGRRTARLVSAGAALRRNMVCRWIEVLI